MVHRTETPKRKGMNRLADNEPQDTRKGPALAGGRFAWSTTLMCLVYPPARAAVPRLDVVVVAVFSLFAGCLPPTSDQVAKEDDDDNAWARGEGEGEGEGEGAFIFVDEEEPNGGDPVTATNRIALDQGVRGAVATANDADVYAFASTPGHAYRARCVTDGSPLSCHLTVLDDGRSGDPAGDDYVRLAEKPTGPDAMLTFVALGQGGHYVIVRDARAVGGVGEGGNDFTYTLAIDDVTEDPTLRGVPLAFPEAHEGSLPEANSVQLHAIDAVENADVVLDIVATGDADLRAFVFSVASGDWVLRNDNRGSSSDPRLDAFFPEGGPMVLLIEAVADDADSLGYTVTTSGNSR